MLSGQIVKVPTVAEVEGQYDLYSKDRWNDQMKQMTDVWRKRQESMAGMSDDRRRAKQNGLRSQWEEEDNAGRAAVLHDIVVNGRKLNEELWNNKPAQERVAFSLSRISPVSAFQLAVTNLAGTGTELKNRCEDVLNSYRTTFNQFKDQKQKESGGGGKLRISVDSRTGIKIDVGREIARDLSTLPQFAVAALPLLNVVGRAIPDFGLLIIYILIAIAVGFFAFHRYDVR